VGATTATTSAANGRSELPPGLAESDQRSSDCSSRSYPPEIVITQIKCSPSITVEGTPSRERMKEPTVLTVMPWLNAPSRLAAQCSHSREAVSSKGSDR
jgi:hypothetical protein